MVDDADPIANLLDVLEDVAGHEDGDLAAQVGEELEHLVPTGGVERAGGLVEEHDLGPVDQRLSQVQPFEAHAPRITAYPTAGGLDQAGLLEHLFHPRYAGRVQTSPKSRPTVKSKLPPGHPAVEPRMLVLAMADPLSQALRRPAPDRSRRRRHDRLSARPGQLGGGWSSSCRRRWDQEPEQRT